MKGGDLSYLEILLWLCTGLFAVAALFTGLAHNWIASAGFVIAGAVIFILLQRAIQKSEQDKRRRESCNLRQRARVLASKLSLAGHARLCSSIHF
jgi:membrane protein implicated in regulation of membrane protease activity